MPDVPIAPSAPSNTDASTNGVAPPHPYSSSDTNAIVPDVEILMEYQERDLDEGTYSLLFAPNRGGIHNLLYTGDCVCPTDTGHPAVDDRYAACIPGIDSWAIPSPITPTTTIHSDFGDDDGAELALTPISIPDNSLSVDGPPAEMRGDPPFEGEAEAERARGREAKRVEVQREETVAEESDEMAAAAPGTGYKRKRNGRQVHHATGIDDEFSDDEVVKKTGPADRRRRANGGNNNVYDTTTTTTPGPTAHSTRPKTIAPSRKESLEENGTEDSTSDSESDSRAVQRAEMGQEGVMDVDLTGTWVEGLEQKTEDGYTMVEIQDERTGTRTLLAMSSSTMLQWRAINAMRFSVGGTR
ncbi:uncharacterized protein STEHIDRAFT_120231 [Stereum hirsutum FP-91666 SS1]|uniref:uncharacterized protein n=1 Tax=Stereum hirsutum (strain FP-91666) TaxID=721885 RepID=UPI000440D539|nr:uncharacterized protein STEHIDRAFT_120231 [Stereum hirsutum FP-91666 SS1]EIM88008.1 hypothetical protein STEHIDRAFT_120231 [Stereum hirsutum FP-91666 SS1]